MFGAVLVFTSGSFDLLIGGWELVGITSVLLISFFQERSEPVQNAIRVFATYRGCDIGLLVGAFVLYEHVGPSTFANLFIGNWPLQTTPLAGAAATTAALLLLLAACGKSAQVPFCGWLPERWKVPRHRALSSMARSRFISERISCCELIRSCSNRPWQARSLLLRGILSALHGTLVGRACADVKTQLAYASVTQLGVIFAEIGLGFPRLALLHIIGHAVVRMLQFRARHRCCMSITGCNRRPVAIWPELERITKLFFRRLSGRGFTVLRWIAAIWIPCSIGSSSIRFRLSRAS